MVRARVESGGRMTAMAVFGEEAGTRGDICFVVQCW